MIQQLLIDLWLFFSFKRYQKQYFFGLFKFFILKVYVSFQFCYFIINALLRIALQWPRLPGLSQGQVSRKVTRGCRRLKWQCGSPAAANWIHSSLPPTLCTEREELPCLTRSRGWLNTKSTVSILDSQSERQRKTWKVSPQLWYNDSSGQRSAEEPSSSFIFNFFTAVQTQPHNLTATPRSSQHAYNCCSLKFNSALCPTTPTPPVPQTTPLLLLHTHCYHHPHSGWFSLLSDLPPTPFWMPPKAHRSGQEQTPDQIPREETGWKKPPLWSPRKSRWPLSWPPVFQVHAVKGAPAIRLLQR